MVIENDRFLAIQESLIGFFSDEVVNLAGKHYYDGSKNLLGCTSIGSRD
jgi:hypothetical protein